jgi:hypothetical protein
MSSQNINPRCNQYVTNGLLILNNSELNKYDYWVKELMCRSNKNNWTPDLTLQDNRTILTYPNDTHPYFFDGIYEVSVFVNIATINLVAKHPEHLFDEHICKLSSYLVSLVLHHDNNNLINNIEYKIFFYIVPNIKVNIDGYELIRQTDVSILGRKLECVMAEYGVIIHVDNNMNLIFNKYTNNKLLCNDSENGFFFNV